MKPTKLKSWLKIAANVGLLAGLALVAYEIHQNSQLARMALVNEGNVASNEFYAQFMGESSADVAAMSIECPEAMTYSDFLVMDAFLFTAMNFLYRNFELAQEGIFTEKDWQAAVEGYASWYLGNPFGRAWWQEEGQYFFADEFGKHVDQQLNGPGNDSHAYWLATRVRLLGPDSRENEVRTAACPARKVGPGSNNTVTLMNINNLSEFAAQYTAAWCSQEAARVAAMYDKNGSLTINKGDSSIGQQAITAAAQGFMTAFPDMVVQMDGLDVQGEQIIYRWTLIGTNTGPGGSGNAVRISGYEEWTMTADGLIAASLGNFDAAEYERQLREGVAAAAQ